MKKALYIIGCLLLVLPGCTAAERWQDRAYFTNIDSDNITLGGAPLLIPAAGEMYISTPVMTSLTLVDTYYKALGTTTSGELRGFTDGNGRLTYTDVTSDRICLVTGAMSLMSDEVNNVITAKLYINGLPHDSSAISVKLLQIGDIDTMTMVALATLQPGDYIEVWIASDKAAVKVTVTGLTFTATTVD